MHDDTPHHDSLTPAERDAFHSLRSTPVPDGLESRVMQSLRERNLLASDSTSSPRVVPEVSWGWSLRSALRLRNIMRPVLVAAGLAVAFGVGAEFGRQRATSEAEGASEFALELAQLNSSAAQEAEAYGDQYEVDVPSVLEKPDAASLGEDSSEWLSDAVAGFVEYDEPFEDSGYSDATDKPGAATETIRKVRYAP